MRISQFELFTFRCWLIDGRVDEFNVDILRLGNRSLFRYNHETACATDISIFFFRFEIFKGENGKKYFK